MPVTVKCRIGIDDQDPEVALDTLARAVVAAGCDALIVHARKAWLSGLSPKENRDIPPLDYDRVYRLKRAMADVPVIINGGIPGIDEARAISTTLMVRCSAAPPIRSRGGCSRSIRNFSATRRRMPRCRMRSRR